MPEDNKIKTYLRQKELDGLPVKVIHRGGEPVKIPVQDIEYQKNGLNIVIKITEEITE